MDQNPSEFLEVESLEKKSKIEDLKIEILQLEKKKLQMEIYKLELECKKIKKDMPDEKMSWWKLCQHL